MEKRKRSYDLEALKKYFSKIGQLGFSITGTAFNSAQQMGFSREDIVKAIQELKPSDFYKSMTSRTEHRIWQDVYHLDFQKTELYIKFTVRPDGNFLLISFKEK